MDRPQMMDINEKFQLVRSVGEECQSEAELRNLLERKPSFVLYDGFEPSGRMHIAQGVFKAMNVNKCTKAGGTFIFWVADWFALMNDKMGGDLEKIKTVGKYLIEVWKAAGMDMERVKFLWSSDEITQHAQGYWTQALDIARHFSLARIMKCCTIMGRAENKLTAAQILYPIMQCTDIFFLKADICQLGVDQRKVNMLARDYCDASGRKLKPIILSHHMLYGLKKGQAKMSKSDPDSAIFMEDTAEDVERKLRQAFCPVRPEELAARAEGEDAMQLKEDLLMNPCLDYVEHILFCVPGATFTVGGTEYNSFESFQADFLAEKVPEETLKDALITAINSKVEPVRQHFENNQEAKELLALIKSYSKDFVTPPLKRLLGTEFENPFVVFSPLANANWTLDAVLTLLKQFRAAPAGQPVVFWVRDWSSFVQNACGGETKVITASFNILVECLKAASPVIMKSVTIITQSEAILKDPSNYWISVINVGRKVPLNDLLALDPANTNQTAGFILSTLMHVGDVLATCPGTIVFSPERKPAVAKPAAEPVPEPVKEDAPKPAAKSVAALNEGALQKLSGAYLDGVGLTAPKLVEIAPVITQLRLKTEGFDDPDLDLFLLDSGPDVARKLKKSFCEPQNIEFNPPLVLIGEIIDLTVLNVGNCSLKITRGEQHGGDKEYTELAELKKDFVAGSLHPGDLKPPVTKQVDALMAVFRPVLASDGVKKSVVDVKNFIKKSTQKKK